MYPISRDLNTLYKSDFQVNVNGVTNMCRAVLLLGTTDLMAKAPLLEMAHHNGSHGCISCEEPGVVVKSGKGTVDVHSCFSDNMHY